MSRFDRQRTISYCSSTTMSLSWVISNIYLDIDRKSRNLYTAPVFNVRWRKYDKSLAVSTKYRNVTDERTDGRMDGQNCYINTARQHGRAIKINRWPKHLHSISISSILTSFIYYKTHIKKNCDLQLGILTTGQSHLAKWTCQGAPPPLWNDGKVA